MPLFKKKKAEEPQTDNKDTKSNEKDVEKKEQKVDDEENDETESESEDESSEEEETQATEPTESAAPPEPVKKQEQKTADDDDDDDDETEASGEEESSEEESEEEETETPTKDEEETTTAQDATLDMSAAPTEYDETLNTTAEPVEEYFEAIEDFEAEQDGDLSVTEGERLKILRRNADGWWEVENEGGETGHVPSTFLRQVEAPQSPQSPKSAKELWGNLKKVVKKTTTTDVLHMMGSVPTGFRREYLKPKESERSTYAALMPKLSPSHLFFSDLMYDPKEGREKARPSPWCRTIILNEFRNICLPGKNHHVLKRYVRICIFDGRDVRSNIIKLDAMCVDKEQKTWTFVQKESEQIQSGKLGQIFVRTDQKGADIGILFELSVAFTKENTTAETEMICGWSFLPLFEEGGNPTPNKQLELAVNGGTPEEKGVPLDAEVGTGEQPNVFRSLLIKNRAPNFSVRILQPSKEQKELLDLLPDNIIGSAAHITALSYYRQILADQLLRERIDIMSTEGISDPFLAMFPKAANDPFYMDLLRNSWIEANKKMSRQQKKDPVYLKSRYKQCFMNKVYPRMCLTAEHQAKDRREEVVNPVKSPKYLDPLAMLLSPDVEFRPFHTDEITFNVVNSHCTRTW